MTARGTDQSLNGARALITGGFGFVGSQLCRALVERGSEVAVLDDLSVGSAANLAPAVAGEVRQLVTDVRDVDAVERHLREFRPTRLFHLAAVHFIPTCETQPTRAVGVNVTGTQSVLEACARTSVESVVVASSGAVYAPAAEAHTEDDAVAPTDIYGYTKEWTEKLARYFYDRTSTPVGIARIFNVIGPGETNPHLLPAIIEQIRKGGELRLGNLATRRDYVFSGDVAEGLSRLAEGCREPGILTCNLGSESAITGAELVELVARAAGREVSVTPDPARFRESDRPILLSDCSWAQRTLDWRAETTIEDAVSATLDQPFAAGFVHAI
jgi:UDP-glucose 4-epimerase